MKSEEKILDLLEKGIIDVKEAMYLISVVNKNKKKYINNQEIDNLLGENNFFSKMLDSMYSGLKLLKNFLLYFIILLYNSIKIFLIIILKVIVKALNFVNRHIIDFLEFVLDLLEGSNKSTVASEEIKITKIQEPQDIEEPILDIDPLVMSDKIMTQSLEEEQLTELKKLDM